MAEQWFCNGPVGGQEANQFKLHRRDSSVVEQGFCKAQVASSSLAPGSDELTMGFMSLDVNLARGVHPKVVQEALGHATIVVTLDLYSHVLPSLQREAAKGMGAALFG